MALLESVKIPIGTQMPSFSLADPDGRMYDSDDLVGDKGLLVVFTCNHCPYALAVWGRVVKLAERARSQGIETVAINPNINPKYPDDAPEKMSEMIVKLGFDSPYLVDEDQTTARDFKAQCTPDVYLFDGEKKLVYHGRIDDNWRDEAAVTKEELKEAIDSLASGRPVDAAQNPSMGCSIKWMA